VRITPLILLVGASVSQLKAQQPPPNTDIFLATITLHGGALVVGRPENLTSRPGYDNQPSFTPDGESLLYTSVREDAQADIYRFDRRRHTSSRLTTSAPESEYSATVMPDGQRFSVIRVERDSTQRLWSFDLAGGDARVVIPNLKPVGYHAWLDSVTVAAYVLGSPNTLYVVNVPTGETKVVAHDIGRSLVPIPGRRAFSFLQRADSAWWLEIGTLAPSGDVAVQRAVRMPAGADYVAWMRDGTVITATGARFMTWREGQTEWTGAADLASQGIDHITRLTLSPDEHWMAFVAEPRGPAK
jgi:WD40 repeat protein